MKQIVDEILIPLNHTRRFAPYPTLNDKSIAAHSWDVAMLSYLFAQETDDADPQLALEKAILHDVPEAETGDIPRFVKRSGINGNLDEIEREVMEEHFSDPVLMSWIDSKDNSIEGEIVAAADILCAIIDFYTENKMGNELLAGNSDIWDGIEDAREICEGIGPAEKLLEEIESSL